MIRLNNIIITAITFIITPTLTFAMTCPNNFSIINVGDTIDHVTSLCGKPDNKIESVKPNDNVPQEWSYLIPSTVAMYNPMQPAQGSLKTTITFDNSGSAVNISVNGIGVGASTICGSPIQLGDSRDSIKSACGDPAFINKQESPTGGGPAPEPVKVTEFDYTSTNPPGKLIFENGKLVNP